jgi:hypothetical protein
MPVRYLDVHARHDYRRRPDVIDRLLPTTDCRLPTAERLAFFDFEFDLETSEAK